MDLDTGFMDLTKASDSVDQKQTNKKNKKKKTTTTTTKALWLVLMELGCSGTYVKLIRLFHVKRHFQFFFFTLLDTNKDMFLLCWILTKTSDFGVN